MNEYSDNDGARAFALFWIVLLLGYSIHVRFAHPDMTTTRLLIEFWWLYPAYAGAVGLYFMLRWKAGL